MGIAFFLFVRLSLVLPAVAVDGLADLRSIWRLSQGQFWRLCAVLLLVSLPAQLVSLLVLVLLSGEATLVQAVARTLAVVFEFVIFAITMTALALSYRWLAGPPVPVVVSGPGGGTTA
jgi:membrane-anchored glycerophosphoryl diester phosphodiesterase (GDPDase)